jgi:hypothetical protein
MIAAMNSLAQPLYCDESWIEHYREQGYAVFPRLVPDDVIDAHLAIYEGTLKELGLYDRDVLMNLQPHMRQRYHEAVEKIHWDPNLSLQLCRHPAMHNLTSQLFGQESVAWEPFTIIWGGGAVPHRDILLYRDPPTEAARFWVALEDIHPESGLLYMVPGTQKNAYHHDELLEEHPEFLEILRLLARGGASAGSWNSLMKPIFDHYHNEAARIAESHPKHVLNLRKGDAVLFNPGVIHGSLVPGQSNLTRRSFIMECRSRNCRAYGMRAYFGAKHDFRRPENAVLCEIAESQWGPYCARILKDKMDKFQPIVGFA